MLVAWCFAEIIRNIYYISSLLGLTTPSHYFSHLTLESACHQFMHAVTWLQYTAFYVLCPVGAGSEYALIFTSFPSFPASMLLGLDVDTSYLDEIQGIESLMLVPALVGMRTLSGTCPGGLHAYQPALSQSPASPLWFDWPCDGFYCTILRYSFVTL